MTDRWHCVAVITLSALRVLPGSCKRTLLSMALTPHRDMESAVTCMTTSSPGTAEDGENCSPTWHSDRTVDGVKIWCAGWKRNNKRWICSPFIRSDDDSTLFYLPCSPSVMEHRAEMQKTQLQQGDQGEFYLVPGIPGFDSNRFDLIFFVLFSVFEKETGRRCLPLVILGSSPWCIAMRTNQSDLAIFLRVYCAKSSGSCFHNTHCIHNILDFHTINVPTKKTGKSIQWDLDLIRFEESQCSVLYYLDNEAKRRKSLNSGQATMNWFFFLAYLLSMGS